MEEFTHLKEVRRDLGIAGKGKKENGKRAGTMKPYLWMLYLTALTLLILSFTL